MAATVDNATVDTAAGLIAAPYGPLTRVTDAEALPTPNSEMELDFTLVAPYTAYHVSLSYEQLQSAAITLRKCREAVGESAIVEDLVFDVDALNDTLAALTGPHTYAERRAAIEALRAIPQIRGL